MNHKLINQTSGNQEYYTPSFIIEAARRVMGSIDLDPASSEKANEIVKAKTFYTKDQDGLAEPWFGNVWLNHPFGRIENPLWIQKATSSYRNYSVDSICILTYACTSESWFKELLFHPQCFLSPRTNYLLPDGTVKKGVTKGSVVTYLGEDMEKFKEVFKRYGVVK